MSEGGRFASANASYYQISYGKRRVPVYRVYAKPLVGVTPIPESPFTGRANVLFACEVDVEVLGDDFLPAYTEGDNRNVVATDSMKNIILKQALDYDGATLEGYLAAVGRHFIERYDQLHDLRLGARELPFPAATVPDAVRAARSVLYGTVVVAAGAQSTPQPSSPSASPAV